MPARFDRMPSSMILCATVERSGTVLVRVRPVISRTPIGCSTKLIFAINSPHEAQVDPHRFLYSRFGDVHDERIGQVRWSIFPCRKWRVCALLDRQDAHRYQRAKHPPRRSDHRSQSSVRFAGWLCASLGSLTHTNSIMALANEKRRFAVPCPGCRFEGASRNPN